MDTVFVINTISDPDAAYPSFEFTPNKTYLSGNIVPNDTSTILTFTVDYTPAPVITDNNGNLWLIIGLSIGGGLLLLIIIGLIVWRIKKQNKNEDDEISLY